MKQKFDPVEFSIQVGQELVSNFEKAGFATTPGIVGSAREVPVRDKLEQLLPNGLAVGTGCVIDSYGSVSQQMDIVIYERLVCPVYRINQDPSATFFPCEGVVAVGEIKSSLSSKTLQDAFSKIESTKKLRRYVRLSHDQEAFGMENTIPFRTYGNELTMMGIKKEEFDQNAKPLDQIFGFVLVGSVELSPKTLCKKFAELSTQTGFHLSPNTIIGLDGGILAPVKSIIDNSLLQVALSPQEVNNIYFVQQQKNSFQFLLSQIYTIYRTGRTVDTVAFDRYFARHGIATLPINGHFEIINQSHTP